MNFDNLSDLFYKKHNEPSYLEVEKVQETIDKADILEVLREAYLSDDREAVLKHVGRYLETQGIKPIKGH